MSTNQTDKYCPRFVAWGSSLSPLITSSWPDQPAAIIICDLEARGNLMNMHFQHALCITFMI